MPSLGAPQHTVHGPARPVALTPFSSLSGVPDVAAVMRRVAPDGRPPPRHSVTAANNLALWNGPEHARNSAERAAGVGGQGEAPFIAVQANPPPVLPSLVLPPAASTEPPLFVSLMRMGDVAMVRGDVTRARALYERASAVHPTSSAALIAAGKTYDPNMLSLLNVNSAGLADTNKARDLYERARALGDPAAAPLLAPFR